MDVHINICFVFIMYFINLGATLDVKDTLYI